MNEIGEAWPCPNCRLMVTEGHTCQYREAVKCSDCNLMITKDGSHKCPTIKERLKAEARERAKQRARERKEQNIKPTIKMLKPKEEMTFMEMSINGDFEEVTVEKNPWQCLICGLVWQTKHEAEECESRGHVDNYTKRYGVRYVENGRPVGGYEVVFKALRKEQENEEDPYGRVSDLGDHGEE